MYVRLVDSDDTHAFCNFPLIAYPYVVCNA
jgi:hypothetical protein